MSSPVETVLMALSEIELMQGVVDEGLMAVVHSILFLRAHGAVVPNDYECTKLTPLTFPRITSRGIDLKVNDAIKNFKSSLTRVGSSVKGVMCIKLYYTVKRSSLFGFSQVEEKVVFEKWVLPVVVRSEKSIAAESLDTEARNLLDYSRDQVQRCLIDIFERVNMAVDHLPTDYNFELEAVPYSLVMSTAAVGIREIRPRTSVSRLLDTKLPF